MPYRPCSVFHGTSSKANACWHRGKWKLQIGGQTSQNVVGRISAEDLFLRLGIVSGSAWATLPVRIQNWRRPRPHHHQDMTCQISEALMILCMTKVVRNQVALALVWMRLSAHSADVRPGWVDAHIQDSYPHEGVKEICYIRSQLRRPNLK